MEAFVETLGGWRVAVVTLLALVALAVWVRERWARARAGRHVPATPPCPSEPPPGSPAADVLALLGGLTPGGRFGRWTIEQVHEPSRGGIPVALSAESGLRFLVEILRADPADPAPPASTGRLAIYLVGVRRGSHTPEDHAQAALALAAALADAGGEPPTWLLTFGQRAKLLRARGS